MLTNIQNRWVEEHKSACSIAKASKEPMAAMFIMYELYNSLTSLAKSEINTLLIKWVEKTDVVSVNSDELYTALACITEYKVVKAIPAMERLCIRLRDCKIPDDPQGYNEREKVLRKLQVLKTFKTKIKN